MDANKRTVFGPVTKASIGLLEAIADNSNLVLDPEVDTFYLVNALVVSLPKTLGDVGQLWGWGTFGAAQQGLLPPDLLRYSVWNAGGGLAEVAFHIDAMRDGNLTTRPRA